MKIMAVLLLINVIIFLIIIIMEIIHYLLPVTIEQKAKKELTFEQN